MSLHSRKLFAPFRQKFHRTFPTFLVGSWFSYSLANIYTHFFTPLATSTWQPLFFLASRRHTLPIRSDPAPFLRPRRHTPRERRKNMGKIFFTSEKRERT